MAATPERPGFLLLWIAAVVLSLTLVVAPLLPGPQREASGTPGPLPATAPDPVASLDPMVPPSSVLPASPADFAGEETVRADAAGAVLHGRVVDEASLPCPDATVRVRRPGEVRPLDSVATDARGHFRLDLDDLAGDLSGDLLFVSAVRGEERSAEQPWRLAEGSALSDRELLLMVRPAREAVSPRRAETRAREHHSPPPPPAPFLSAPAGVFWWPQLPARREDRTRSLSAAGEDRQRVEMLLQSDPARQLLLLRLLVWLRDHKPGEDVLAQALAELPEDLAARVRERLRDRRQGGDGGRDAHAGGGNGGGRDRLDKAKAYWKQRHDGGPVEIAIELTPGEAAKLLEGRDRLARRR